MRNYKRLILTCGFINVIFIYSYVRGNEFLDKYEITCPAVSVPSAFKFQDQPWLAPDELFSIEEYESRIARIESRQGVYSVSLIPELVGLGHSHRLNEKHIASVAAYQRALDILKVNEGLYSQNQIPLLDILIEENSKLDNWERVSDHYSYMHWLYRRNYEENDVRLLSALKRIRRWEIDSYNKPTGKPLDEQFNIANKLHDQITDILMTCTDNKKLAHCYLHNGCCPEASAGSYCPVD